MLGYDALFLRRKVASPEETRSANQAGLRAGKDWTVPVRRLRCESQTVCGLGGQPVTEPAGLPIWQRTKDGSRQHPTSFPRRKGQRARASPLEEPQSGNQFENPQIVAQDQSGLR